MHIAVQALERAKSMGTVENVEELLIVVAERVKERQRQKLQFQKNNNSVQSNKTESGVVGKENGKTSEITSPIATALLSSTNKPNASAPNNGASENRTIKGTFIDQHDKILSGAYFLLYL